MESYHPAMYVDMPIQLKESSYYNGHGLTIFYLYLFHLSKTKKENTVWFAVNVLYHLFFLLLRSSSIAPIDSSMIMGYSIILAVSGLTYAIVFLKLILRILWIIFLASSIVILTAASQLSSDILIIQDFGYSCASSYFCCICCWKYGISTRLSSIALHAW